MELNDVDLLRSRAERAERDLLKEQAKNESLMSERDQAQRDLRDAQQQLAGAIKAASLPPGFTSFKDERGNWFVLMRRGNIRDAVMIDHEKFTHNDRIEIILKQIQDTYHIVDAWFPISVSTD